MLRAATAGRRRGGSIPRVTGPIAIDEARRRVLAAVVALPSESVALGEGLSRVLAEDVRSAAYVPPFDSSAMDGFAVGPGAEGELRVVGEARAGSPSPSGLEPGMAIRISTGAQVPGGTGAVVPVEYAEEIRDGMVAVPASAPGANVRRRGEDLRAGDTVLARGAVLSPAALGVLASVGREAALCARRPFVAVLATGDELVDPGQALGPGQIWSSNPPVLAGQVTRAGGVVERTARVPDDAGATQRALAEAVASADVVCVSGGVSVGAHDHVKGALAGIGAEERFWGVALRPGKPTWFGTVARERRPVLAFGLPGNPVSAMVTFQLFVRPALRALQGADPSASRSDAVLDEDVPRNPRRAQAVRCRLRTAPDGLHAAPTGSQGSHLLTSMLAADALALVPAGEGEVLAGQRVTVELLD